MTQYTEPLSIAGVSSLGILAQIVAPIPDDLKTWPITAILGLLLLSMLSVVAFQSYMANKASIAASNAAIASATAIQAITDNQQQNNAALRELSVDLRDNTKQSAELVTIMKVKPCLALK